MRKSRNSSVEFLLSLPPKLRSVIIVAPEFYHLWIPLVPQPATTTTTSASATGPSKVLPPHCDNLRRPLGLTNPLAHTPVHAQGSEGVVLPQAPVLYCGHRLRCTSVGRPD